MDGSIGEHTFGAYGNTSEMSFTHEDRPPTFLADFSPARTPLQTGQFGRESPYSANVLLDLRLENDRLKTELSAMKEGVSSENRSGDKENMNICLLAFEIDRLNEVIEQMTTKTNTLQTFLEEATRTAGDPGRVKELELQLDNLLSVNQRNLEALKFKKLSLEKARRQVEQLQAENILLKMALEAAILSGCSREPKNDFEESARWKLDYEKLHERYRVLELQNQEQGQFAKELDLQVSQLTKYIQDNRDRSQHFDALRDDNDKLRTALDQGHRTINQLQETNKELTKKFSEINFEATRSRQVEAQSTNGRIEQSNLLEKLTTEITIQLQEIPVDSQGYYDCEVIRLKIQSLKRSLEEEKCRTDYGLMNPNFELNTNDDDECINYSNIHTDTAALGRIIGKTIENLITSQNSKFQARTRSESKAMARQSELNTSTTTDDLKLENERLKEELKRLSEGQSQPGLSKHLTFDSFGEPERSAARKEGSEGCQSGHTTGTQTTRCASGGQPSSAVARLTEQLAMSSGHCAQITALNEDLRARVADLERGKDELRKQLALAHALALEAGSRSEHGRLEAAGEEAARLAEECCLLRARLIDAEEGLAEFQKEAEHGRVEIATLRLQLARLENAGEDSHSPWAVEAENLGRRLEDVMACKEMAEMQVNRLEREKQALLDELEDNADETRRVTEHVKVEMEKETRKKLEHLERQLTRDFEQREADLKESISHTVEKEISETLLSRFKEHEAREKSKLDKANSKIKSLELALKEASDRVSHLESEAKEVGRTQGTGQGNRGHPTSGKKLSECGTLELEDMKAFVRDMKQEGNYVSEGRDVRELKEVNRQLMDQLVKAEQATLEKINHASCEQEREELITEINRLQNEMAEIEKTCRHMRDRLTAQDQGKSRASEAQQERIEQLEEENESLEKALQQSVPSTSMADWLVSLSAAFAGVKQELELARAAHRELARMFVARVQSLRSLFGSEAELAPRGTLAQIVRLKEYNSAGANKLQSTLERVCEQLAQARAEVGRLKTELAQAKAESQALKTEARQSSRELDELGKTCDSLAAELARARNELRDEREAKDRERRLREVHELETLRRADHWQEDKAREREAQNILKEVISEKEEAIEGLKSDKEKLSEEMDVLIHKLEDSESRRRETDKALVSLRNELKQTKNLFRDYSDNKENIRNNESSLASRIKDLESTVEVLTEKLDKKNRELFTIKNSDSKMAPKENIVKSTDRVAVIRSKIELLFEKMNRTLKNITDAESMLYQNPSQNKGMSQISSKGITPLATSFQGELNALVHSYESLGKKYVNEAIDVCQQSLRVFEGMQTAHHRLCPKLAHFTN